MTHAAAFNALRQDHAIRLGVVWTLTARNDIMGLRRSANSEKGNGAIAMREVCALADRLNVTLTLGTSVEKLKPWYQGFGFTKTKDFKTGNYCATFFQRRAA